MKRFAFFMMAMLVAGVVGADQWATTDDGERVLLKSDGTWYMAPESEQSDDGWMETGFGDVKIERTWRDGADDYHVLYALVSYRNTSDDAYSSVTLEAIVYDEDGGVVALNQRSFYESEYGIKAPGFVGTLEIPVEVPSKGAGTQIGINVRAR